MPSLWRNFFQQSPTIAGDSTTTHQNEQIVVNDFTAVHLSFWIIQTERTICVIISMDIVFLDQLNGTILRLQSSLASAILTSRRCGSLRQRESFALSSLRESFNQTRCCLWYVNELYQNYLMLVIWIRNCFEHACEMVNFVVDQRVFMKESPADKWPIWEWVPSSDWFLKPPWEHLR